MGLALVKMTPGDSPSEPGQKSLLSDPFPENVTFEDFFEAIKDFVKYPVLDVMESTVKRVDFTENSPNDFSTKVIMDGAKLDTFGIGKGDGTDMVASNWRSILDFEKKEMKQFGYKSVCWLGEEGEEGADPEVIAVLRICAATPPLAFEYYWDVKKETEGLGPVGRRADAVVGGVIQGYLEPIVQRLAKTKVRLVPDSPAVRRKGLSIVSPPLDEYANYDEFFAAMLELMQTKVAPEEEIEVVSEKQFKRVFTDPNLKKKMEAVHDVNADMGKIQITLLVDGKVYEKRYRRVHKDPFVYEAWAFNDKEERIANQRSLQAVQVEFNNILEKSCSWWDTLVMG